MKNRGWDADSDLPVCAEDGAGQELTWVLEGRKRGRGRWLLSVLCLLLSFGILLAAILLARQGSALPEEEKPSLETEKEKIVFVRQWDEDSGILSTPEIYARCSEGVVTVLAHESGTLRRGFGFFVREDGYIATDSSLVGAEGRITVQLSDGREYAADCVGREPFCEVALLKIEERGVPALSFGKSDGLLMGERVIAVGQGSVCTGEIASLSHSIPIRDEDGFLLKRLLGIQVCAQSPEGYGGAPILNEYGAVVGMVSLRSDGACHVLPSAVLAPMLDAMTAGERVSEEVLLVGATPAPILGAVGASASEEGVIGIRIHRFLSGLCPAASILKEGDLILSVDGVAVRDPEELARAIEHKYPTEHVSVTVLRFGQTLTFEVPLSSRDW